MQYYESIGPLPKYNEGPVWKDPSERQADYVQEHHDMISRHRETVGLAVSHFLTLVAETTHAPWVLADRFSGYTRCRAAERGGGQDRGGEGRTDQKRGCVSR